MIGTRPEDGGAPPWDSTSREEIRMAIQELTSLVPPPAQPLEAGPTERWDEIQAKLGTALPADFRDFGLAYGTGKFIEQGITVFNPFAAVFSQQMEETLAIWRSLKKAEGRREVPYPVFPQKRGLLSWGVDEGGNGLFWLMEGGTAEEWPILVRGHEATKWDRFEMQLTTFLSKLLSSQISLPHVWTKESFGPHRLKFQPTALKPREELKSVFELHVENGNRAGFWVQHMNWFGSTTEVRIKTVAGKAEGTLSGSAPDYGGATVLVDVYENGALFQSDHVLTLAPSRGFRKIEK
jgi:hypothetical protein